MIIIEDLLLDEKFGFLTLKTDPMLVTQKISGFNQIENVATTTTIHPNELILITTAKSDDPDRLMSQVEKMFFKNSIAGLVIKTGDGITKIPESIIQLGNKHGIAIFELPWSIRAADFARDVIELLIKKQTRLELLKRFFSELVFNEFKVESWPIDLIESLEAEADDTYSVLIAKQEKDETDFKKEQDRTEYFLVSELRKYFPNYIYSQLNGFIIFIIKDVAKSEEYFKKFVASFRKFQQTTNVTCTKGGNGYRLSELGESYREARYVRMINKGSFKNVFFSYDELGIYKLLLEISDTETLINFHKKALGPLIAYDQGTNQQYYAFLKHYFKENGHHHTISENLYVHQNTVAYRLGRISEILSVDLRSFSGLIYIGIALAIEDLPGINVSEKQTRSKEIH